MSSPLIDVHICSGLRFQPYNVTLRYMSVVEVYILSNFNIIIYLRRTNEEIIRPKLFMQIVLEHLAIVLVHPFDIAQWIVGA